MSEFNKTLDELQPPPGLRAIIDHLNKIYPDQRNPLQVTTLVKFWLGGYDPLDYISMYDHRGNADENVAPHWHYVTFGLSDLHGDGRVHPLNSNSESSGMGFELTFRLLKTESELRAERAAGGRKLRPPIWPANLLQSIAQYCFQTGNTLGFGDNIPWQKSLNTNENSIIKNILITQDAQIQSLNTSLGTVDFCQVVGVTDEELEQASRWNSSGVLNYLRQDIRSGGKWLITDMNRKLSIFELCPETLINLESVLEVEGSNLAGINAEFTFRELSNSLNIKKEIDTESFNNSSSLERKYDTESWLDCKFRNFDTVKSLLNTNLKSCEGLPLNGIEITLASNAARFLLLAIKHRIRHGRHFTFKAKHLALTLVSESVNGSLVSKSTPYVLLGYWVQVFIPNDIIPEMLSAFAKSNFNEKTDVQQRFEFEWPNINLKIIIENPNMTKIYEY